MVAAAGATILRNVADEKESRETETRPVAEMLQEGKGLRVTGEFAITAHSDDPDPHGHGIRPDPESPPAPVAPPEPPAPADSGED